MTKMATIAASTIKKRGALQFSSMPAKTDVSMLQVSLRFTGFRNFV